MTNIYNKPVTIQVKFDSMNNTVHVRDDFGEFIPFAGRMWNHCVEMPWEKYFKFTDRPYQRVVEIFIGEYAHRYIGKN